MTNEWLAGARQACNDALAAGRGELKADPDRLLTIAAVHALIGIGEEIAGIRELIVMVDEEESGGDGRG